MSEKKPKNLQYSSNPMLAGNANKMARELHTSMADFLLESIYDNLNETCAEATDLDLAIHLDVAIMSTRCLNRLMCSLQVALLRHVQNEGEFSNPEKIQQVIKMAVGVGDDLARKENLEIIQEFRRQLRDNEGVVKRVGAEDIKFTMKGGDA